MRAAGHWLQQRRSVGTCSSRGERIAGMLLHTSPAWSLRRQALELSRKRRLCL